MKLKILTKGLFLLGLLSINLSASEHKILPHWGYTEKSSPENWSKLSPAFQTCSNGANQSPINLVNPIETNLSEIALDYNSTSTEIINNGHTIQVNIAKGSTINIDGINFELKQFHFHTPSENNINGKSFPLEAHFVHASKDGKLAVIGLMFQKGIENKALQEFWDKMPMKSGDKITITTKNFKNLLPRNRDYYRFNGSLTTPPCTEGVRWIVMKEAKSISKKQIERFAKLIGYPNNRPIQPINARVVIK